MQRIHKLDGLRGLFALFVVLFHLNLSNAPSALVNNLFVRESYIFVDFFFILSGYVISLRYHDKINTIGNFLKFFLKRFIRLYPLLLFSILMYWYFVHPFLDKQNIRLALDTLLLTNSTPILGSEIGMNYPSWSISSEMISYLIFGICSLIAIGKNKTILMICITLACFIFLAYQGNYFVTGSFGFVRGLACFNLGFLLYTLAKRKIQIPNLLAGFIPFLVLGLMYLLYHFTFKNRGTNISIQLMVPLVFTFCIFLLIHTNGGISKLLGTRPLQFLGKISYSVYLNQAFVIGYGIPKLYKWVHIKNPIVQQNCCVLLLLITLITYSWITQKVIETKLGNKLNALIPSKVNHPISNT